MADFTVLIEDRRSITGGVEEQPTTENISNQPQTAGAQPKPADNEQLKAKAVAATAVAINAGVNIYTNVSNMQASMQGNSAYQQRVNMQNQVLTSAVQSATGIGIAFMVGGPVVGGIATVASGAVKVANLVTQEYARHETNQIRRTELALSASRLGNAENIWRK